MKDPERAGFQLQLGHCQGTCSKGTADTEYMSIKGYRAHSFMQLSFSR